MSDHNVMVLRDGSQYVGRAYMVRDEEEDAKDGLLESKSFSDSDAEGEGEGAALVARDGLAVGVAVSWGPAAAAREDDNLSLIQYDASPGKGVFTKSFYRENPNYR